MRISHAEGKRKWRANQRLAGDERQAVSHLTEEKEMARGKNLWTMTPFIGARRERERERERERRSWVHTSAMVSRR
jgi:hypothetical protein